MKCAAAAIVGLHVDTTAHVSSQYFLNVVNCWLCVYFASGIPISDDPYHDTVHSAFSIIYYYNILCLI